MSETEEQMENDDCQAGGLGMTFEEAAAASMGMTPDETKLKLTYPENGLKMWTADDEEWCIATSAADASLCYMEMTGGERLEFEPGEPVVWTEEPPGALFRFNDDGVFTAKTNAEWVREWGRGYFASANI